MWKTSIFIIANTSFTAKPIDDQRIVTSTRRLLADAMKPRPPRRRRVAYDKEESKR